VKEIAMRLKTLLLPVALVAGLALAAAPAALAAPLPAAPVALGGIHVGIGVGVRVPIGTRYSYPPAGYWTVRTQTVWVGDQVIGYDVYGNPILSPGHYETQQIRVWVPARHFTRVVPTIGIGLSFR
jgi:hypothetical protein